MAIRELGNDDLPDEGALFGLLRSLETSLREESKKCDLLIPIIKDVQASMTAGDFAKSIQLVDELEEFMDLEFCEEKASSNLGS